MPGFWSGLLGAGAAAATGYAQGDAARQRAIIAEAARRRAEKRDTEEAELRRIAALGTAASQGFDLAPTAPADTASRRAATGEAPTSPEAGQPAASVHGPVDDPTAAHPTPAPAGPPPATADGTPIGEVAGVRIAIPPGGLHSKSAREAQDKVAQAVKDRRARLEAHNATLPAGDKRRMAPSLIELLSGNEQLYSKWSEQAAGIGAPDPTAVHRANRDYDVAHPLPVQASREPNGQVVQTDAGVQLVNPRTGVIRPVVDASGQQVQPKVPEATRAKIIEHSRTVKVIDNALRELNLHPEAVGLTRGRIDALDQRRDPGGVNARAAIAEVGSQLRHMLSGAAVTPSEYQRLVPFIPDLTDSPKAALAKLSRLRELASDDLAMLQAGQTGGAPSPSSSQAGRPDVKKIREKYGLEP